MRTAPALLICLVATLALTGCVPDDGPIVVDPEPSSSASPIFESDEEALAAAEEAYGAYQVTEDLVSADGGAGPERLELVASRDALKAGLAGMEVFRESGYHSVGSTSVASFSLQQFDPYPADSEGVVSAYLCLDLSDLDVVDSSGISVVSANRPAQQAFEVTFDFQDDALILGSREPWDGEGVCDA